jgi:hypothetical protein
MSFWSTSSGEEATGKVEENNFDPLPKGWYTSMLESAEIDEYEGQCKIKLKVRVVGEGFGKNRVLFFSLKCFAGEKVTDRQRDRAIQLLVKIYNICKAKLPDGEPDDASLSQLIDKPIDLMLDVWEMDGKEGNWLVNAEARGTKAGSAPAGKTTAKQADKPAAKREPGDDEDDDIPF